MPAFVFVGVSLDGFLARPDGSFDFLDAAGSVDHGYYEFIRDIDAIVMGRNTFEVVLQFPDWPYGGKRVVVLSSKPLDARRARRGMVEQMAGDPAEIVSKLAATGVHPLYLDGGDTIQRFLRAGQIDRLIISRVPALIGKALRCSDLCRTMCIFVTSEHSIARRVW